MDQTMVRLVLLFVYVEIELFIYFSFSIDLTPHRTTLIILEESELFELLQLVDKNEDLQLLCVPLPMVKSFLL